jgi:hypothetical protein
MVDPSTRHLPVTGNHSGAVIASAALAGQRAPELWWCFQEGSRETMPSQMNVKAVATTNEQLMSARVRHEGIPNSSR